MERNHCNWWVHPSPPNPQPTRTPLAPCKVVPRTSGRLHQHHPGALVPRRRRPHPPGAAGAARSGRRLLWRRVVGGSCVCGSGAPWPRLRGGGVPRGRAGNQPGGARARARPSAASRLLPREPGAPSGGWCDHLSVQQMGMHACGSRTVFVGCCAPSYPEAVAMGSADTHQRCTRVWVCRVLGHVACAQLCIFPISALCVPQAHGPLQASLPPCSFHVSPTLTARQGRQSRAPERTPPGALRPEGARQPHRPRLWGRALQLAGRAGRRARAA